MYCLDTDIVIEFFRENKRINEKIRDSLSKGIELSITCITLCELYRGTYLSNNPEKQLKNISKLLDNIKVLNFSKESGRLFGLIGAELTKKGESIDDADLMVASIVLDNNNILVTNNTKHFDRIKGLKIENWLK